MNQSKSAVGPEFSVAMRDDNELSQLDAFAGAVLGHLRRADEMSLEAVSVCTGLPAAEIAAIEAGEKSLDVGGLYLIAKCLAFDPNDFLKSVGEFALTSAKQNRIAVVESEGDR